MATIGKTSYIFISIIAVLFILSFILAIFAGLNAGNAIIWCISNFLNVSYPGIIPTVIAYKNPLLLVADLLGALDFPILTVLVAAWFFDTVHMFKLQERVVLSKIKKFNDHVILSTYNNFSERLAEEFKKKGVIAITIVSNERDAKHIFKSGGYAIIGNEGSVETLMNMGMQKAKALILCDTDPIKNALTAVTARSISKKIKIISRISRFDDIAKLSKAGVERMVLPEVTTGDEIGNIIIKNLKSA
ncbi:MAG: NAD-binding protein [Candidatus Marsarchaeota archaeon]|nr:NAD-binding protein [Candidatus Marsarchaeota archaeon]